MDNSITHLLEKTGLTKKEAKVYLALLELGQGTASQVSKKTELKRPIIYVILESLIKRGYVTLFPETEKRKINTYKALDPALILADISTTAKNLKEMLPFLQTLSNKSDQRPVISYIETKKGILKVYGELNFHDDALALASYVRINKVFSGLTDKWTLEAAKGIHRVKAKHLLPNNKEEVALGEKLKEAGQRVRFLDDVKSLDMDLVIFGNKLALTSLEKEPFMVLIESKAMASSLQKIFEIVWRNSKKINKKIETRLA